MFCNTEVALPTKSESSRPGDEDIGALNEKHATYYDSEAVKFCINETEPSNYLRENACTVSAIQPILINIYNEGG